MLRVYIFDLDGVIYRGDEPQPHAKEVVQELRTTGRKVYFLTNNSTRTREQYCEKLINLGIPADINDVITSAYATALYLRELAPDGAAVYVIGEEGVYVELARAGMRTVDVVNGEKIDFVVVGLDRQFTYEKLNLAQQAIRRGAKFIATNADTTFPLEEGVLSPGNGSLVAAIKAATDVEPFVIGKPEPYSLLKCLELADAKPEEAAIIGDRLDTDILGGRRAGLQTFLVLTGVATRAEAENAPPQMKPHRIIDDLTGLLQ